ncbi:hypothetical protein BC826DRAFT_693779 [Russula brevipes]|nr:hypothetical protein BC826DRAFT_693779 [Russula brevipes]
MGCVRRYSRGYKSRLCRSLPLFHLFLFLCLALLLQWLHYSMLLSRSKSSLSDPEALPSFLNCNPISFKENENGRVHSSLPQLEQSRSSVETLHPSTGVSQTVDAMSNPSASSTNSQSTSTPSHATSTDLTPNNPMPRPRLLHTSSSRPSSRQHMFPSQKRRILRSGYNSEPDIRSVAAGPLLNILSLVRLRCRTRSSGEARNMAPFPP